MAAPLFALDDATCHRTRTERGLGIKPIAA
jgi:hypothetical protein